MNISKGEGGQLTADEDIYGTADGRVVGADDPAAAELIARAGQPIREKTAQRFGIQAGGGAAGSAGEGKAEPKAEEKSGEHEGKVLGEGDAGGTEIKRRKVGGSNG